MGTMSPLSLVREGLGLLERTQRIHTGHCLINLNHSSSVALACTGACSLRMCGCGVPAWICVPE